MRELFFILTCPISIPIMLLLRRVNGLEERIKLHLPRFPRFINWVWAVWGSYFWMPCPICRRPFGGHESGTDLMTSWTSGRMVCWRCSEEAERVNQLFIEENEPFAVSANR